MNCWRMKLRAGNHGPDMWPLCHERGIAAITYEAIYDMDLTHLTKRDLDPEVKSSARSSIFRFAWEMKGGDEILVGDSDSKCIVARGFITSTPGERAYRFNARNPIREPGKTGAPWSHEVPVDWDADFEPFPYKDGAPRNTVMYFNPEWAGPLDEAAAGLAVSESEGDGGDEAGPLSENSYMRKTRASQRNIDRLHSALSNRFRNWVQARFAARAIQEHKSVDVTFDCDGSTHLAELKICYGGNTRAAIREAMGQLLEYNHYPSRSEAQFWWLVLDHNPKNTDRDYIAVLRNRYALPITLAWPVANEFESHPEWPES